VKNDLLCRAAGAAEFAAHGDLTPGLYSVQPQGDGFTGHNKDGKDVRLVLIPLQVSEKPAEPAANAGSRGTQRSRIKDKRTLFRIERIAGLHFSLRGHGRRVIHLPDCFLLLSAASINVNMAMVSSRGTGDCPVRKNSMIWINRFL
jgi:hypothetical protein